MAARSASLGEGSGAVGRPADRLRARHASRNGEPPPNRAAATKAAATESATRRAAAPVDDDAVTTSRALVPVEREPEVVPESERLSDVDEWGRSEHIRGARPPALRPDLPRLVPGRVGGPREDPHRRRRAARRQPRRRHPVRRAGDHARHRDRARAGPSTAWPSTCSSACPSSARCGPASAAWPPTPTTPTGCCTTSSSSCSCSPRARKGPGKLYTRALPAAPVRARRLRRDRHAGRRAGRADRGRRRRGVDADPLQDRRACAKLLGIPYFPITANMLLFGPLGLVAYFPAKFKLRVLDPVHFDVAARPGALLEEPGDGRGRGHPRSRSRRRSTTCCAARRSVWFG